MTIASLIVDVAANTVQLRKDAEQISKQLDGIVDVAKKVAGALGIAFSIRAIVDFVGQLFDAADQLTKLSDKTGIGVEALQRLGAVAADSGNSIDQITAAISQMQKRLAGGDQSAVRALEELHLNLKEILALSPDQQFIALAKAIAAIPDPAQRVNLAMALFGKTGAEILPTLRADIEGLAESTAVMSRETVKTLDDAGDAWATLWRGIKVGAATATNEVIKFTKAALELRAGHVFGGVGVPGAPGGPGGLTAPGFSLGVPSSSDIQKLKDLNAAHLKGVEATSKHKAEQAKLTAEYRQFTNWLGERQMENLARQIKEAEDATEDFYQMLRKNNQQLVLFSREMPQMFMGLADGTRQVLEPTRSWRDTLHEVTEALGVVGDKWASFAVGMIRNLEAIVQLWQAGFKAAAIGQAIGALGQFIPVSDRASVSAAKFATQGAAVGSTFGPWGLVIGAAVGALYGWIKATREAKQNNYLRDAFIAAHGGLTQLHQELVRMLGVQGQYLTQQLLAAKNAKQFQAVLDEINRQLDVQQKSYDRLKEAVARYQFSIEDLGPALQRQQLDEQAQQIYEDWMLLVGAGIDSEVVARRMADAINAMVKMYLTLGLEVPPALKPILQQLIQMGLLTDANGDLITDLEGSGIHFAETMSEGFTRVVDAINEMVKALRLFLGLTEQVSLPPHAPGIPPNPKPPPDDKFPDAFGASYAGQMAAGGGVVVNMYGGNYDTPAGRQDAANRVSRAVMDEQRRKRRLRAA